MTLIIVDELLKKASMLHKGFSKLRW